MEVCTTGGAIGLACEMSPTPVEASRSNISRAVPGRTASTETVASAQACPGHGDSQKDIEGKTPTIENNLWELPEMDIGSKGGVGNCIESASRSGSTAICGDTPKEGSGRATPLPGDSKEEDREQVPQTSSKASMDHLRRAALAALSRSAEEDASIGGSKDIDQATKNRRPSAFVESEPSSSCPSPLLSPRPSSQSPSSPCGFLQEKSIESSGDAAHSSPTALDPTPNEAKPSKRNPVEGTSSSATRGNIIDSEETTGGAVQPARTAVAPRQALETAERESDSFPAEDERTGETPVSTCQS